jgi:ParB/RepB/Spo0J family partition protein
MPLPTPTHAVKPLDFFVNGDNVRDIVIDDILRDLNRSLREGQVQPVGTIAHGDKGKLIYGFRRFAAALLGGVPTLSTLIYPPTMTLTQIRIAQATENLQRVDLSDPDIYRLCKELMELNPEWQRKELAAHLNKHASTITHYLSPDDLIPEALKAFMDRQFGFSVAYAIANSPDQLAMLSLKRSGATRDDMKRNSRRQRNGNGKAASVTAKSIPLVLSNGLTITFKAEGITLSMVLDAVPDIRKELADAIKDDHDAKTFGALMKKRARQLANGGA